MAYAAGVELIFLRHGEPQWSVDGINQRDPDLTALGHRQAVLAAKRLAGSGAVSDILVSPAKRAQQTAIPLLGETQLEGKTIDDLEEIRLPNWDGKPEDEVLEIFANARDRTPEEWWDGLPGGESFRDFHRRVTDATKLLLEHHGMQPDSQGRRHLWHVEDPEQRLIVVAHAGTNAVAIGYLLGSEPTPWEWERFILGHASIARLRAIPLAGEHVFSMRAFNDREHLGPADRTR